MDSENNHKPQLTALRIARLQAGKRLIDVAPCIGRNIQYLSRLELGQSAKLTPEIAIRLAKALDVDPADLFEGKGR